MIEKSEEAQKQCSKFHRYLAVCIFIYIIENFTHSFSKNDLTPILVILPFAAFDFFVASNNFFESSKVSTFLRFSEMLCALMFLFKCSKTVDFAIALTCYIIFSFELVLHFDFSDLFYKVISVIMVSAPLLIGFIITVISGSNVDGSLLDYFILFSIAIYFMFVICNIFFKNISYINEKMYAQERIISNANRVNEELRLHQEKVKKANEQLGVQKIKLEAANEKIKSVNAEMMIQNDIIKYISSSLEIEKLMTLITDSLFEEMGLDVCAIIIKYNEPNKKIEYKIKSSFGEQYENDFGEIVDKGELEEYMNTTKTFIDNNTNDNTYSFIKRNTVGSLIIVPFILEDTVGALFVGHPKCNHFGEDVSFFESIVSQFAIALQNAKLYSKMEYMAIRDGLTGIYNRRYLTKLFNEYLNQSIFNKTSLTIALFDIDKFKNINDTYGHIFGDEVIKVIANLAKETANENGGIVGRYGGEEFVIVFPNKNLQDAYPSVKQLHHRIKETELHHNGQSIFVRVSVGITSYPGTCKNPSELLNRADWAMYYSKQNGRDRITIDSDEIRECVMIK